MSNRKMLTTPMVHHLPNGERLVEMNFDKLTVGKFKTLMESMNAKTGFVMRMCDAGNHESDDGNVNCECKHCQTSFDLCSQCVPHHFHDTCPAGYGCRKQVPGYILPAAQEDSVVVNQGSVDKGLFPTSSVVEVDTSLEKDLEDAELYHEFARSISLHGFDEKEREELFRKRSAGRRSVKKVRQEMGFDHDHQSLNHH